MNRLYAIALILFLVHVASAREQSVLARVTVYWSTGISKCDRACATGSRLRAGHCAVDPKRIPYGSKVSFPDGPCVAVDTGPDVINRKAARFAGRNLRERSALAIDRFFETKRQALAWAQTHPQFMTVQIVSRDSRQEQQEHSPVIVKRENGEVAAKAPARLPATYGPMTAISFSPDLFLRFARRRA